MNERRYLKYLSFALMDRRRRHAEMFGWLLKQHIYPNMYFTRGFSFSFFL